MQRGMDQKRCYVQYGGGAIANVARHLAMLNQHAELITAFAPDPFGTALKRELKERKVGLSYAETLPEQETPLCFISNTPDGERYFLHRGGDPFGAMSSTIRFPTQSYDWLVWGISSMRTIEQRFIIDTLIDRHSGITVCDPGTCPSWWGDPDVLKAHLLERLNKIDILKCSQPEAEWLSGIAHPGEAAHWLALRGPSVSIVTAGADGLYCHHNERAVHLQVAKVDAVDTTGAGDATLAGILVALNPRVRNIEPAQLSDALVNGARMGTQTVLFQGAGPWSIE